MPLVDENRLIVKLGLEQMRHTSNLGLKALLDVAGVERGTVNEGHIGFSLAPRINASGRMQHANLAVRLLTTESEQEAEHLAYDLDVLNKERQKTVEDMMKEALALLDGRDLNSQRVIIAAKEGWNVGVAGIAASKLLERFYRPAIVFAVDEKTGLAKGSARSIPGFDIHHALTACSDLLDHFGGHQAAAGLTLRADRIPELENRLSRLAMEELQQEDLMPIIQADLLCSLSETTLPCIEQLSVMAPFGSGNPAPRFVFNKLRIAGKRTMGKDRQHLKLTLEETAEAASACSVEAVSFNCGQAAERLAMASSLDLVGELSVNVWNGSRKAQILIHDMRVSEPQVFDWRGTASRKGMRPPELPEGSGILIFHRGAAEALPQDWRDFPLWLVEEGMEEDPRPMNRTALLTDFAEMRDAVLYTLPSTRESLDKTVALLGKLRRVYAVFADALELDGIRVPDREVFKHFYGLVLREKELNSGDARVWPALKKRFGLEERVSRLVLEIFEELGFVRKEGARYCAAEAVQKRDLTQSALYRRMINQDRMEQLYIYSTAAELRELILEARPGDEESTFESKRRMNP
jgi:single-stranded-DNA-specific exonuclease